MSRGDAPLSGALVLTYTEVQHIAFSQKLHNYIKISMVKQIESLYTTIIFFLQIKMIEACTTQNTHLRELDGYDQF